MKNLFCLFVAIFIFSDTVYSQTEFEDFLNDIEQEFNTFREESFKEFDDFRNRINDEYINFLKEAWGEFNASEGIAAPEEKEIPPVTYPEDDEAELGIDAAPVPISIDEVIPVPESEPQPQPVVEIEETPMPVDTRFSFGFFGNDLKVRLTDKHRFTLKGCDEYSIADGWSLLSGEEYNNVINDCLSIRSKLNLCDWAYLLMLDELSNSFFGKRCNEATLLTAFIYCQSGYKMRLANDNVSLFLLYASKHEIYDKSFWNLDGERYYCFGSDPNNLYICNAAYPDEKPLSLFIGGEQALALQPSETRTLKSEKYGNITASVSTNKNLIDFYDTYPSSMINGDFGTRWAMYANTPLSQQAKSSLYPTLSEAIRGMNGIDAANCLLNFVQTAFEYELDDKVWGGDRAFFPDETLFYPYCDCEDRSILFSRLVRDLLGLEVILVYYPGHIASAVCFSEPVGGDHVLLNGKNFTICDPTYIGAPVGKTMPGMNNASAKVILLE